MVGLKSIGGSSSIIRSLNKAIGDQQETSNNLARGKKKFSSNPAAAAIAADFAAAVDQLGVANRNISDAVSVAATREAATDTVAQLVDRRNELAVQASNGTLSDEQRASLDAEYQQLGQEIDRVRASTEFNGRSVFDETTVQVGTDSSADSQIALQASDLSSLETSGTSIATREAALSAVDKFAADRETISQERGKTGAVVNRLERAAENNSSQRLAAQQTEAAINDTDVAEETAKNVSARIRANQGAALLAQANQTANIVKNLIA